MLKAATSSFHNPFPVPTYCKSISSYFVPLSFSLSTSGLSFSTHRLVALISTPSFPSVLFSINMEPKVVPVSTFPVHKSVSVNLCSSVSIPDSSSSTHTFASTKSFCLALCGTLDQVVHKTSLSTSHSLIFVSTPSQLSPHIPLQRLSNPLLPSVLPSTGP